MIITRFAPSPTGYLHIGSARTALFNYLYAKHMQGKFLLRIEDTDRGRSTREASDAILTSMQWLGLDFDGDVVYQFARAERHVDAALRLLKSGGAYYCFSTQEEIEIERRKAIALGKSFLFQSPWRDADPSTYPKDQRPVVRMKATHIGSTVLKDLVQGDVVVQNSHIDDMVLLRSDGSPTYMLAVVVDDHDMGVTHIIRGDDHLTNASRQMMLYQAFGWDIPQMAHIPLIHGPDGAKLSKRHGAVGVEWYRNAGYVPEALCNYLLRLGWSHGDDEIISRLEAVAWFNIESIGRSPSRLDFDKLSNLNGYYIKNMENDVLVNMVVEILSKDGIVLAQESVECISKGMPGLKTRAHLITDLATHAKIYIVDKDIEIHEDAMEIIKATDVMLIEEIVALVRMLDSSPNNIQEAFKAFASDKGIKIGEIMKPVRALLTGLVASPSVFEIISIIGIENSVKRLKKYNSLL
jgi:glutamyl-tRNA synthetase